MNAPVKAAVIDASVALKWIFNDEEAIEAATVMLQRIEQGVLQAHVPDLFAYEVSNALWAALRQGRLTLEECVEAVQAFRLLQFIWHPLTTVWDNAFAIAVQYDRSFYDSVYVALAQHLQVPLFTGDRRLYHALHRQVEGVHWVGDYH
jgi:predicted nucleic acid-binding protein